MSEEEEEEEENGGGGGRWRGWYLCNVWIILKEILGEDAKIRYSADNCTSIPYCISTCRRC